MKIHFSKKEYRLLLDMLHLADWMMHAHTVEPEVYHEAHRALHKKLLSYAKEMDAEDIVEYAKEFDEYFELRHYEDALYEQFIVPYDEGTFWDALMERLSNRDLIQAIGEEKYGSLEGIERIEQIEVLREFYAHEFEKYGLQRLIIQGKEPTKH